MPYCATRLIIGKLDTPRRMALHRTIDAVQYCVLAKDSFMDGVLEHKKALRTSNVDRVRTLLTAVKPAADELPMRHAGRNYYMRSQVYLAMVLTPCVRAARKGIALRPYKWYAPNQALLTSKGGVLCEARHSGESAEFLRRAEWRSMRFRTSQLLRVNPC